MKYLASLLLLIAQNVSAINLCDQSCDLIITFPDTGAINAAAPVTMTFGEGGYINDGVVTTGYAAGETKVLTAGESVVFSNGGMFVLGTGGNIDYSDMEFNSSGGASLTAVGGTETIAIENLMFSGGINITLNAKIISVTGTLSIDAGSVQNIIADTGSVTSSVCSVQDSSAMLTITAITISTTSTCNTISLEAGLSSGQASIIANDPNLTLSSAGIVTLTGSTTLEVGELTLTEEKSKSSSNGAMGWWIMLLTVSCLVYSRRAI